MLGIRRQVLPLMKGRLHGVGMRCWAHQGSEERTPRDCSVGTFYVQASVSVSTPVLPQSRLPATVPNCGARYHEFDF